MYMYIYGRANERTLQLFTAVRFVHKAYYIAYSCKNKFTNYDFRIEEASQSSTDQLYCSSSSFDGDYTDAEVGEIRDM